MGVVYKGYDEGIDRYVAIKTVHRNLLSGEEGADWLQRFRREARAAGRCLHQNIVTIFEFGEQEGMPYIVMEFVEGQELSDMIRARDANNIDRARAVEITAQVLDALEYAHANGIVHRDIKPGNIIILKDGTVKVTDFGIARIDSTSMTAHGSVVGTPSYMSPEQFTGQEIDRRSDIFSTGVVLFELLTGQKPFPGKSATEVMYKLLNHQPPAVDHAEPDATDRDERRGAEGAVAQPRRTLRHSRRVQVDDAPGRRHRAGQRRHDRGDDGPAAAAGRPGHQRDRDHRHP